MFPVILAMAEAEGPTSVLAQVLAPLLKLEEVQLARVWFMDDRDCPVCALSRSAPPAPSLHLRASGERSNAAPSSAEIGGACHLIHAGGSSELWAIAAHGKPLLSSVIEPPDRWGLESDVCRRPYDPRCRGVPVAFSRPRRGRARVLSPHAAA